ncbi:hypothetical protein CDO73_10245 [Saccharibacillus sp. O23]|uniref:hypothetical protein n=1 Tax=Saccharibacillus sp. O23 TaxID=2009338 RepID=UPI000B4E0AF5|nr:hypothetical protein [Saccharibacillus sp. O23]OWR30955.1 hypothetical protein CDO73_10245 [Saccharibacillus sp. O23]
MRNQKLVQSLFAALSLVFLISGCGSVSQAQTAEAPAEPIVTTSMEQVLPDGTTIPVETIPVDEETGQWLRQKQADLTKTIAKTAGLNESDVMIVLAALDSNSEITCTMVLNTEDKIENKLADQIREQVIKAVEEDPLGAKIPKENITISNGNGQVI